MSKISRFRRNRARELRVGETEQERRLWRALKDIPVYGSHFRRQCPIGPFIADFACLKARLLIELDGGHHSAPEIAAKDAARSEWLSREGYTVIRFWNAELIDNLDGVLDTVYAALYGSPQSEAVPLPTPPRRLRADPPPQGEGE
jgi:very-short-patch-repair endonuclease